MKHLVKAIIQAFAGLAPAFLSCSLAWADMTPKLAQAKPGEPIRIVTYGTSLTAVGGWQSDLQESLRSCTGSNIGVVNLGQGRMASDWGLGNVERVIDAKPDIILIEFSINDAFIEKRISLDESMQNNRSIIRKIRDGSTKPVEIYLMTMNYTIGDIEKARPNHARYYELYRHLAAEEGVRLIDNAPLWRAKRITEPEIMAKLIPDTIHPTADAFRQVALPNILNVLSDGRCRT
jgi:acyl-CoA thioesterase-1